MIPCYVILFKIILFLQTNTFQGILATDFVRSFAVFTYMCGDLSYSTNTIIGFFSEDGLYATHPASDRGNAMAVACLNYPDNPWVNVVYKLTAGKLKELNTKILSHTYSILCNIMSLYHKVSLVPRLLVGGRRKSLVHTV